MDNGAASYRRFIDGDQEAFGEIVDLYRENLIFFIHRYVNDLDTAEDLAEDAFVELIVHPERFEGKSSLKTFLFAIARNKAVDWLRKHKRMKPVPLDEIGEIADLRTLEQAVAAEDRKRRHWNRSKTSTELRFTLSIWRKCRTTMPEKSWGEAGNRLRIWCIGARKRSETYSAKRRSFN